jgi:hypothetical protein
VGRNIDVDLTVLQDVLLEEPTAILGRCVPIASLHEGIPQQHREVVMVQTPHAQPAVQKGVASVISHLRQDFGSLEL